MKKKEYLFFLAFACVFSGWLNAGAQNQPPQLSEVKFTVDTAAYKIAVKYRLTDAENNPVTIVLKASDDGGLTFRIPFVSQTGDVGANVTPSGQKQLIATYDPQALNPQALVRFKLTAYDDSPVDIQKLVDDVKEENLKTDVAFLSQAPRHRTSNPTHLAAAKDKIEERFIEYNLPNARTPFTSNGNEGENIWARKPGVEKDDSTTFITGHFDTVAESPGADDNASAVAGVLEAMRILSQYEYKKTLKFLTFDLEEANLGGSTDYVANQVPDYEKVQGVLDFEMIGYYNETANSQKFPAGFELLYPEPSAQVKADSSRGNFITNVGNTKSKSLLNAYAAAAAQYVPGFKVVSIEVTNVTAPFSLDLLRSDHAPFWAQGYKALMLTDGANFRNLAYHTASDTMGALNFTFMANVVKTALATAAQQAEILNATSYSTPDFLLADSLGSVRRAPLWDKTKLNFNVSPNPFGQKAYISFKLDKPAPVLLSVYNTNGEKITTLVQDLLSPCDYIFEFDVEKTQLAEGLYFVELNLGGTIFTKRILHVVTPMGGKR